MCNIKNKTSKAKQKDEMTNQAKSHALAPKPT
jgi:hypothetical protein